MQRLSQKHGCSDLPEEHANSGTRTAVGKRVSGSQALRFLLQGLFLTYNFQSQISTSDPVPQPFLAAPLPSQMLITTSDPPQIHVRHSLQTPESQNITKFTVPMS